MRTPLDVANDTIYDTPGMDDVPMLICMGDEYDYVPLEHQDNVNDACRIKRDAIGIVKRLVAKERAPYEAALRDIAARITHDVAWLNLDESSKATLSYVLAKAEALCSTK